MTSAEKSKIILFFARTPSIASLYALSVKSVSEEEDCMTDEEIQRKIIKLSAE